MADAKLPLYSGVTLEVVDNGDEVVLTFVGAEVVELLALEPVNTRLPEDKPYVRMLTNICVPETPSN